jgi:hypothetical protein
MKTADNKGRAILRINIAGGFPGSPVHKPAAQWQLNTGLNYLQLLQQTNPITF